MKVSNQSFLFTPKNRKLFTLKPSCRSTKASLIIAKIWNQDGSSVDKLAHSDNTIISTKRNEYLDHEMYVNDVTKQKSAKAPTI